MFAYQWDVEVTQKGAQYCPTLTSSSKTPKSINIFIKHTRQVNKDEAIQISSIKSCINLQKSKRISEIHEYLKDVENSTQRENI